MPSKRTRSEDSTYMLYPHACAGYWFQESSCVLKDRALTCRLLCLAEALRTMLLRALTPKVESMVRTLQKLAFLYSAQGIRHDGHYKLQKRIVGPKQLRANGKAVHRRPCCGRMCTCVKLDMCC